MLQTKFDELQEKYTEEKEKHSRLKAQKQQSERGLESKLQEFSETVADLQQKYDTKSRGTGEHR